MGDDAAFEAALRAALSKLIAVKPRACVEPPRASKLARCASVASYPQSRAANRGSITIPASGGVAASKIRRIHSRPLRAT